LCIYLKDGVRSFPIKSSEKVKYVICQSGPNDAKQMASQTLSDAKQIANQTLSPNKSNNRKRKLNVQPAQYA
jgi:hypothetical protein